MPVEARPATTGYRIRRFVDRNRPAVLGAAGALVALVVGLGVAVWQGQVAAAERDRAEAALVEAAHERDRAQQQAARAGAVQTFLVDMIGRAAPATTGGTALTVREVLDEADTELMTPAMQNQPEVSMQVRTTLGRMYRVLGRGEAAVRQGRLAYRMGLQHLGAADSLTLQTGSQYGISLLRTGQIQKADSLYGILVPRLNHVEASPALRFVVLSHYGEVLRHQSRLDSAEAVLDTALRWYDRSSQPDTTLWTTALSNLGGVYRRQGRLDDAEDAYRRALTIAEERASEERLPSIAILANNLGNVYANRGDYAEAEPLLRRSLTLMTDLFGETSGNVAATLTNLSRSLYEQGKLTEADRLSKRAVALHREVFPPSDYRIGFALGVRARILLARGQWRATQTSADESLRLFRNALGAQHPATLGMHQTLADVHERLGAWDAAATHSKAALAGYRAVRDSTDAAVIGTRVQLGRVRTMQGRYDEAERLLLAAHRVQTGDSLTSVHRETHNWLVRLYDAWGRPDAAERWRGEAQ
jgi:tetratricopeptide (TPR) repeat protein